MKRLHNPFQSIDLYAPEEYRDQFSRYCQTRTDGGRTNIDASPFPRMVDLWFLALCIAVNEKIEPAKIDGRKMYKIIDGAIFSSDPWRISALTLIALGVTADIQVVDKPRDIMKIATGFAVSGLPRVIEMLGSDHGREIFELCDNLETILRRDV